MLDKYIITGDNLKFEKRSLIYAIPGGILGGIFIMLILFYAASSLGLPYYAIYLVYGLSLHAPASSATNVGYLVHYIAASVIAMLFISLIQIVKPFKVTGAPKTILLGLVYGVVVFVVFFVPLFYLAFAPVMVSLLGKAAVESVAGKVLLFAFIVHVVYGLTIGSWSFFVIRVLHHNGKPDH
jgi:hypothetical protein